MMRHFTILACMGLALIPDWASAFGLRRRVVCPPPAAPFFACPPRLVLMPACLPPFSVAAPQYAMPTLAAPSVQQERAPTEPPQPEPPKVTPDPDRSPMPRPVAPGAPPGSGRTAADPTPDTGSKPTGFTAPPVAAPAPLMIPKPAEPAAPKPAEPAVPSAPVMPKGTEGEAPKIPPLVPRLPNAADPTLPPLTLPSGTGEPPRVAKSSPINAAPVVDVFPVDGPPPASPSARRQVGFFNYTGRDLKLTVEGESVTLPKRHSVTATVPAKFAWRLGDEPARRTEVPTAAPGVEVVIRR